MTTSPRLHHEAEPISQEWGFLSPATESEANLMRYAMAGNRMAYATLFGRVFGRLWSLAYLMLHDARTAGEVVQRAYSLGVERLNSHPPEMEPAAWFCLLTLEICRRAQRASEDRAAEAVKMMGRHEVVTLVLRPEAARQLTVALGFLTPVQREVFLLRYVEGLSYGDIASILNLDAAVARLLGHQARAALRRNVGRDFPDAFPS
ncbi:MAG: RNA polymerase sigma factor [Planctomycetes bacterium]|nr:RNA polymerase sigma factor [Planctomycetota bacterium]